MKTFEEFVVAQMGGRIGNMAYERGMYAAYCRAFEVVPIMDGVGVPYQVVGGVAVNAYLLREHRDLTFVPGPIDFLLEREHLALVVAAVEREGYATQKALGSHDIICPGQHTALAMHIIFARERTKSTQPLVNPEVRPERKDFFGVSIPVIPLDDLILMKLTSFRPKDVVYLQTLADAGLITEQIVDSLPEVLRPRWEHAKRQFLESLPDVEQPD
ncbi:MAG: hypothetical protein SFV18_02815 [Bryobacteraceae bacterium]|nr:hypothetical protein [Bryobacteraceae bacterium]